MKAKSLVLMSVFVFGLSGVAFAMPPKQAPDFQRLASELQITGQQQDQFLAIMEAQHEERKALHQQGREAMKDEMREKMQSLDESVKAKLEALLTSEQMDEFLRRMEKRKQTMQMRRMLTSNHRDCCSPPSQ